jgi:hypothetical protein
MCSGSIPGVGMGGPMTPEDDPRDYDPTFARVHAGVISGSSRSVNDLALLLFWQVVQPPFFPSWLVGAEQ